MKDEKEWLLQAEYDLTVAEAMHGTGKYIYTVFMCHLCVEKALKAVCVLRNEKEPPKTHDLLYLLEVGDISPPPDALSFLKLLSNLSVPTRYPEDLRRLSQNYDETASSTILNKTREVLSWLKLLLQEKS